MIPYGQHYIDEDDVQAVAALLRRGPLTQGPAISEFEQAICNLVGAKYAVAVASASAGLHLAAIVAGVGPRKDLITTPITFVASATPALYTGAKIHFADVDANTVNMSPEALAVVLKTNPAIRAVVPVHFTGLTCDMVRIKSLADQAGAVVIEDAAHALGSQYPDGGMVGNCAHSLLTVFSFHPVKAIAAGEGGMITTNDEKVYRQLLRLRAHGINKLDDPLEMEEQTAPSGIPNPWYYEMQEVGYHYRITDLQCVLAKSQLNKLEDFVSRRRELVANYDLAFADFKNCRPAQLEGKNRSGNHIYVLRINYKKIGMDRATLMGALRQRDIGSQVHYIPVPCHPIFRKLGVSPEDYPEAYEYYQEALTIPLYYKLSNKQQQKVIRSLQELVG